MSFLLSVLLILLFVLLLLCGGASFMFVLLIRRGSSVLPRGCKRPAREPERVRSRFAPGAACPQDHSVRDGMYAFVHVPEQGGEGS